MRRLPITLRLTVAFAAAMLLVLLSAALFVALRLRADLDDQINNNLRARNAAALNAYREGTNLAAVAVEDPEESFVQLAKVDQTVQGPHGPVSGAIVVDELGVTGAHSQKTLAPGYGEFLTADGPDLEAMAVTVPADAQPGGVPLEIRKALTAAWGTLEYVRAEDWPTAGESVARTARQVAALDHRQQPPR
ncbi:MAG TPA: hypothetical protein VF241_08005 [Propionibacteriaceae bacterium]